jgi:branched-chain amino acid transport system ATP-binding protein
LGIALVPEGRRLFPRLTVLQNLRLGAYLREDKQGVKADLEEIFSYFPVLKERQSQYAGSLSGGEQQMLAIGRALMSKPKLLLLDEPSIGLSPLVTREIGEIIARINQRGVTIFLVEQNVGLALRHACRGYVLEIGRVILHGVSKDLLDNKQVRKAYLGE